MTKPALLIAREVLAKRAEADNGHHTADCYRSGRWDEQSQMVLAVPVAEAAQSALVEFLKDIRTRAIKEWGHREGTRKLGAFLPAMIGDYLDGETTDQIWSTLKEWAA